MGHERQTAPDGLRRILQAAVFALENEAVPTLASWLNKPEPAGLWGNDVGEWLKAELERLPDPKVYDLLEHLLGSGPLGDSAYDERGNAALREAGIGLVMIDGCFYEDDQAAEEFAVEDLAEQPLLALTGPYATAGAQWAKALAAQKAGDDKQAVALAVNTLEGVVKIASGQKDINQGLRVLFPEGERSPLRAAINQLHNYGSAMPWVRHGGGAKDLELHRIEARGVLRATAAWIVMLINLHQEVRFS